MCQIIAKPFDGSLPEVSLLKEFMRIKSSIKYPNGDIDGYDDGCPDGFSIAWTTKEDLILKAAQYIPADGASFIKQYDLLRNKQNDVSCIVHLRHAPSSKNKSLETCHCWKEDGLDVSYAMNGTISVDDLRNASDKHYNSQEVCRLVEYYSDAWFFFKKILVNNFNGDWDQFGTVEKKIEECKHNKYGSSEFFSRCNRVAVINSKGVIRQYGQFYLQDGCFYSNYKLLQQLEDKKKLPFNLNQSNVQSYYGLDIDEQHIFV